MPEKIQDLMESLKADLNDTTTVSISQISTPDLNTSSLLESIEEKPGVTINSPPSNSDPFFTYKAEKELENEDKHFWTQQYVTSEPDTSSLSLSSTSLEEIEAQDVVPAASSSNSNNLNKVGSPSVTPTLPLLTPLRGRKLSAVLPARRRSSASPASLKNVKSNILKTGLDYNWFNNTSNLEYEISDELRQILDQLKKCMDLRAQYMEISLQHDFENPKNDSNWNIYPPPPPPSWISTVNDAKPPSVNQEFFLPPKEFQFSECKIPDSHPYHFELSEFGVFHVYKEKKTNEDASTNPELSSNCVTRVPSLKKYFCDLEYILNVISSGPIKSYAYRRLRYLESRFNMYVLLNDSREYAETKSVPHRDFYNVRKVDTHVHHSACMNQKHLLRFIKNKMRNSPDDVVIFRDQKYLTLSQVFESLNLTAYDLSVDTLDMHAHKDSFHRFDKFNLKYNPIGESRLREIFMKTDNLIKGRYLAEITKEVINDLHATKYQHAEYRISVYGRDLNEWDKLAKWVLENKLFSNNIRWLVQIPRLYSVYKASNNIQNFEQFLINIFQPLFEVTKNPKSHPELHILLERVVGLDSVDDESKAERRIHRKYPYPKYWNTDLNPPYSYYLYYIYANMTTLNQWRKMRGFNTFVFRPHAGEAGDTDHLTSSFLTSYAISHGILLRKVPALQYLYYLMQIGLAMSPLSNNALFLNYERNPFPNFFQRGLNVSLSTDDPLQFHFTKEPLIEEYSVAAQIYKLSPVDMCELARNSVIQSGWEHTLKQRWLGDLYYLLGSEANDINKTNVPSIRMKFRCITLLEELHLVLGSTENISKYLGRPISLNSDSTEIDELSIAKFPGHSLVYQAGGSNTVTDPDPQDNDKRRKEKEAKGRDSKKS